MPTCPVEYSLYIKLMAEQIIDEVRFEDFIGKQRDSAIYNSRQFNLNQAGINDSIWNEAIKCYNSHDKIFQKKILTDIDSAINKLK